jgi:tripartite-type tricarboxylate transporter receptor subunit TctC
MVDVISGQVPIAFDQIASSYMHVEAGKLRVLAITSAKRFPTLPNVPTIAESGVKGYEADSWNGLAAPAGTPKDIVMRIQTEVARVLHLPDMKERLLRDGIEPIGSTPDQFAAHIRSERAKWEKVIERAGIKPI